MFKTMIITLSLLFSINLMAATTEDETVLHFQTSWALIKYERPEQEREAAFKALSEQAKDALGANPESAELMIWNGIILSTYAGEKGGLGALGLVKKARKLFEQAIAINPNALQGSAYTSLGSLYYQVPGWPIGFGSDKKAEQYLQQALTIDPDGIDSNFFYGDFLLEQNRKEEARMVLQKALQAPARSGRKLADKGRLTEIQTLLDRI